VIVADTHVLLWWIQDSKLLSPRARRAMEEASVIGVAAISCWEIAMLAAFTRIMLHEPVTSWVNGLLSLPRVELLPLEPEIAIDTAWMGITHRDPADRMLMATARYHGVPLVTKDARIRDARVVETIW
jgi:PIN domain nuclease of toxin-antitoxin system